MKSFESTGVWHLPSEPDKQLAGDLTFSPQDGLRLRLTGTFNQTWGITIPKYPVIHGVVSESPYGKFFSLFDSFPSSLKIGMPGVALENVTINSALRAPSTSPVRLASSKRQW